MDPEQLGSLQDEMEHHRSSSRSLSAQDLESLLSQSLNGYSSNNRLSGQKRTLVELVEEDFKQQPMDGLDHSGFDSDGLGAEIEPLEVNRQRISHENSNKQPLSAEMQRRLELKTRLEKEAKRNARKKRKQFV